ncbi:MarR family winged helix-turn-helix transcriptional regulator [Pseudobacteriovorax antillogorgiicola]|uniref:DNA-binding transcriptional regulator, MarR family n=1 Tax=Pseudobacteriovorax antillogorgiicola TaxID=1513793 RepID=A0A1Y6CYL6_9BACT|nr:MarR family transcriptional regulator [Pseudobacteriovorax antillogorgiicola]TCS41567.1 DNA-binding MarR family transcriptional regulator [Pseudobacteriovorax antillogorgiicola]SMF83353.1 DNA-binding transcriptional regulator, MarR family [Pseudobacteriovorax antillogorgiicola]
MTAYEPPGSPKHFGVLLDQVSYLVERKVIRHLKEEGYDLTFLEVVMLIGVVEVEGINPNALAERTLRHKSIVARVTKRLEGQGMITRTVSEVDGRSWELSASKKGIACYKTIMKNMEPFRRRFEKQLNKNDLNVFHQVLMQFRDYLFTDSSH